MRFLRRLLERLANFATRRQGSTVERRDGGTPCAADGGESARRHAAGRGATPGSAEVWRRGSDQGRLSSGAGNAFH